MCHVCRIRGAAGNSGLVHHRRVAGVILTDQDYFILVQFNTHVTIGVLKHDTLECVVRDISSVTSDS